MSDAQIAQRRSFSTKNTVVPCKAVVGCAPAATYAAPRSAGTRGSARRAAAGRRGRREVRGPFRAADGGTAGALVARAPQGTRSEAEGAASERRRIPGRGFAKRDRTKEYIQ